jgi:N6-L-threonylcarbamoyladenine synthase
VVKQFEQHGQPLPVADLAASFQAAVVETLVTKTIKAAADFGAKEIIVAGGVSANKALRQAFTLHSYLPVHIPHISLCTDNAAMIACAGYYRLLNGHVSTLDLDAMPTWPLMA